LTGKDLEGYQDCEDENCDGWEKDKQENGEWGFKAVYDSGESA